jgi:hypothetical protein
MHSWLPDQLDASVSYPFTREETKLFFQLLGVILTQDQLALSMYRPKTQGMPTPSVFEQHVKNIIGIEQNMEQTEAALRG